MTLRKMCVCRWETGISAAHPILSVDVLPPHEPSRFPRFQAPMERTHTVQHRGHTMVLTDLTGATPADMIEEAARARAFFERDAPATF